MLPLVPMALIKVGAALAAWETAIWARRRSRRRRVYEAALNHARAVGRPLVVVGAPDGGLTQNYGCGQPSYGDKVIDLAPTSQCPNFIRADITKRLPFADDSVVVFQVCVLELVHDLPAALREIQRISGGHVFHVHVDQACLTSVLYPGVRQNVAGFVHGLETSVPW